MYRFFIYYFLTKKSLKRKKKHLDLKSEKKFSSFVFLKNLFSVFFYFH
jgi:hypothetical protein